MTGLTTRLLLTLGPKSILRTLSADTEEGSETLKSGHFFVNKFGNLSVSEPSSVSTLSVLSYGLWP